MALESDVLSTLSGVVRMEVEVSGLNAWFRLLSAGANPVSLSAVLRHYHKRV